MTNFYRIHITNGGFECAVPMIMALMHHYCFNKGYIEFFEKNDEYVHF